MHLLSGRCHRSIALLAIALAPPALRAQRVTGPWDDGSIAPRGVLRVGISPRFGQWKERYSSSGDREALGTPLSPDSLGISFPFVAGLAEPLAIASGLAAPPLSLGTLRTRLDVTEVRTHIALDYGLTSRLGLQALIPYVKNRVHVRATVNEGGIGATLGFNPVHTFNGARQQNELVVTSIGFASSVLTSELTRCMGSSDPSCAAINANRTGAQSLVQLAGDVAGAIASVYGTSASMGGLYAPAAGSSLQTAVEGRLTTLNTQFRTFLGAPASGEWIGDRPVPAAPLAAADFDELLGGDASGVLGLPLADYEHSHVGDIEFGAKFLLVDTFGPVGTAPLPRAGALRLGVSGVYRLPTGQLDLPGHFADIGTGDRQADLELRGHGDVAIGPRFWVSSILRLSIQNPDRLVRRIPTGPTDAFPEAATEMEIDRDLGDVIEFEVAPRYVPNNEFALSALYRFRTKGADVYEASMGAAHLRTSADGRALSLHGSTLAPGSEQKEHLLGFAVTYSTVYGNSRGSAKWPLEVAYMHTAVFRGDGVPRLQMNGISLRIYR
jgi:hypothetical protein